MPDGPSDSSRPPAAGDAAAPPAASGHPAATAREATPRPDAPEGGGSPLARARHAAFVYGLAIAAGYAASAIGVPLPWMIGSLLLAAGLRLSNRPVRVPMLTRPIGQALVASSVGLAFTPAAVAIVAELILPMAGSAVLIVAAGFVAAAVVVRIAHVDAITATLASVPMGPVESANLARRYAIAPGPVVFSQTIRIVLLILIVPPALVALDGGVGNPDDALRAQPWTAGGAALLALCAAAGGFAFRALGISNPYFLGPLAGSAGAAALALPITAYPYLVLAAAQIFLGVWLGAVLDRALIRRAGTFMIAAFASTLVLFALCLALALALAHALAMPVPVMILSIAPGSVTEMALTAKILDQGVAVVTAFHIVRIFIIIPSAPLIIRLVARAAGRPPPG